MSNSIRTAVPTTLWIRLRIPHRLYGRITVLLPMKRLPLTERAALYILSAKKNIRARWKKKVPLTWGISFTNLPLRKQPLHSSSSAETLAIISSDITILSVRVIMLPKRQAVSCLTAMPMLGTQQPTEILMKVCITLFPTRFLRRCLCLFRQAAEHSILTIKICLPVSSPSAAGSMAPSFIWTTRQWRGSISALTATAELICTRFQRAKKAKLSITISTGMRPILSMKTAPCP